MKSPLTGDHWLRRGISLLWDAEVLATVCKPKQVISLRQFLLLQIAVWPKAEYESLLCNDGNTLVVAGLESAIDALTPEEAEKWLCDVVYKAMVEYQTEVAGGGTEASLILWIADHKRLDYHTSDDTHYWHCGTEYKGQQIPLTRCLFNGGQGDRQPIMAGIKKDQWIGLYHPKIKS